jgi:hypothetical protein
MRQIPCGIINLASFQGVSIAMELSVMFLDVVKPPEDLPDDCVDDSGRTSNTSDVVSMQFNTLASITMRRPTQSSRVDLMEKRKRPSVVLAETSNPTSVHVSIPVAFSNLDIKTTLFSPIVSEIDQPSSHCQSPDMYKIPEAGYVPYLFDLGISANLRKIGPDVKPFSHVGMSEVPVNVGREIIGSDVRLASHVDVNKLPVNASHAVTGFLDKIPDNAFDEFIMSIPDCELSDSDDGTLSEDVKSHKDPELGIGNNAKPR